MINIFLVLYFVLLALFLGGVAVVIYHLWSYQTHKRATIFTILLFSVGAFVLLCLNIATALNISWENYKFIF